MTPNHDDQIADLVSARALNPDLARPEWVTPQEWEDIGHLADIERELRAGAVAPPLADDRTAAMLGLLPDPNLRLDPAALRRTRQRAGLNASDLATQLTDRGWEITAGQVFHWENRDTAEVPPALIEAIAAVLHSQAAKLVAATTPREADLLDTEDSRVQGLTQRLAAVLGIDRHSASSRLRAAAVAAVNRGDKPRDEHLLATLEAYVDVMERRRDS